MIFEKWLPYKKVKRPILLQTAPPLSPPKPTRNVIIEYEPSKAYTVRRVIEEGVFRVDPRQYLHYNARQTEGDVRIVDRIDDLPLPSDELKRVLVDYAERYTTDYDAGLLSEIDRLTDVTRLSNSHGHRQERVLSPGRSSAIPSPTLASVQNSSRSS